MQLPLPNADLTTFAFAKFALELFNLGLELVKMMYTVVGYTD